MKSKFHRNGFGLFFNDNQLLSCTLNQTVLLPIDEVCAEFDIQLTENNFFYLGEFEQKKIYAIHIDLQIAHEAQRYLFRATKDILVLSEAALCQQIHRAKQLLSWHRSTLFCGQCGSTTHLSSIEWCKICDTCNHVIYPYTSPAIIVLIHHKNKLLLGRSPHFPPTVYSNLAGFVEPGENCEEAIHREVAEEVGIQVKNIHYMGSQSWPFPNSFMMGFSAEYASGEISVNFNELEDAQWFEIGDLPDLPLQCSIARWMIDEHQRNYSKNHQK